ncbi:MAG: type II toxin-antitoxin system YafQ family toxin [Anaerolineae bacterium]
MTLRIRRTSRFKKDVRRMLKRGKDLDKLVFVIQELSAERKLPARYRDHPLKGQHRDKRDCHIEPDWILLYAVEGNELVLYRTGTHSDLFAS